MTRGTWTSAWRALLLALAVSLVAAPLAAQGKQPSAAEKDTARSLMKSGDTKFADGDFRGALKAYKAADHIMAVPSTRLALGRAQAKTGKLVEARDTLLSIRRIPQSANEPAVFQTARNDATKLAGELDGRIPSVTFAVKGVIEGGATLTWDGATVDEQLWEAGRRTNPGKHTVKVIASGYQDVEQTVTLKEGERREVALEPKPGEGSPPPPAQPAATPGETPEPEPPAEPPTDAADDGGSISPLVYIGFGLGGAGIIVGAITGGLAASQSSDLKDSCTGGICPPEQHGDLDDATVIAHVSTASFIVGGVGIALGLVGLLALSGGDDSSEGARVVPLVGPGSIGLRGSF